MTVSEKLLMCSGCEQDFYNGQNPYGIKRCWSFEKARVVLKKKIHINQVPPWEQAPIKVLSCRREKGYVFWDKDRRY